MYLFNKENYYYKCGNFIYSYNYNDKCHKSVHMYLNNNVLFELLHKTSIYKRYKQSRLSHYCLRLAHAIKAAILLDYG